MKTLTSKLNSKFSLLLIVCMLLSFGFAKAQSGYEDAMKESLATLDTAKTKQTLTELAGAFERISNAEQGKWEPAYHYSLCKVFLAYQEKEGDKIDGLLDEAEKMLNKSIEIFPNESELYALQGMIHQARISVNSMRGMKYSGLAEKSFEKALSINPLNPRANHLMGMSKFYTPSMFGGGKNKALPYFEAAEKAYSDEKPTTTSPRWGQKRNEKFIELCKKEG